MYVIHKTNASALALLHLLLRSAQAFSRNIFALSIINQNVIFVMNIRQPRLNVMRLFACSGQSKLMPSSKLFLTQLSFNPLFRIFSKDRTSIGHCMLLTFQYFATNLRIKE
jgi:hypothetical protein